MNDSHSPQTHQSLSRSVADHVYLRGVEHAVGRWDGKRDGYFGGGGDDGVIAMECKWGSTSRTEVITSIPFMSGVDSTHCRRARS